MSNIKARINQQNQIVASKVEVNTAGISLADLTDVNITTPSDGSYIIYDSGTNTFLDDQTIVKTATGISLTGTLNVSQDIDVDGTLEADAITVNGITLSETIADTVGAMVTTSNSESGISVTYEDDDNTLDFNVQDFTITLTGDVTGEGTVTDLANVSFATTIQPNSVVLGTDTTGNYVSAIAAGSGIDSTGAWFGEGILHTLTVDLNELPTETSIEQADFVTMVDATDNGSGKITFSHLEDTIFGNVAGDITIAAGGGATIQASSVENSMLAGSITNNKLSNSTVSYGGVQLSLGGNDDTPEFDLQDATNLPATSLTGSMPDARIPLSNVTQHQASLSIATTQLTGTITNAQLAGSITNDKLVNSSITVSDGTNTSDISLGSTLTFSGTANEVDVSESAGTVTFGLPDDVTITGNLTVNGTTTTINSTTLSVDDKNIELGSVGTPTDTTADGGGITLKGTTDKTFNWIDSTDSWTLSENLDLASGKTYKINGTDVLSNDTLGTGVVTSSLTTVGALDAGSITSNFGDIDIGSNVVTAEEFIGDLRGAVRFKAKAGEALTKGDVVYISGVSGQKPLVSKALSSDADKMPAFGLANATVNINADLEVISFGTFAHGDTSGGSENWEFGDVLYVSAATAGALTNIKPTGSGNLLQNVGKVERAHASSGSIMVAGAGRTNATPNLDDGKFFIGNSTNQASQGLFNSQFTNTSGTISLNQANITGTGTITTGVWQGTAIADTYISSAATWNAKQAALTFGIANTNAVKIDSADVADDEYAKFTANGLEGRTYAEVLSDIGAQAALTFGIADTNVVKINGTPVDGEFAQFTSTGLVSRTDAQVLSDIGAQGDLSTSSVATLSIDGAIEHTGDTDTHIAFADNRITLTAGNVEMIDIVKNTGVGTEDIITIGDPVGGEFQFNVTTGAFHADGNITAFSTTTNSDINLKKNITPIEDALTKISQLNGVNFQWKKDDRESMGFIAQNVQEVIPELVHSRSHNDRETLSVEYGNITALLVEGMKQQSEFIEKLESRIKTLEDKLDNGAV